ASAWSPESGAGLPHCQLCGQRVYPLEKQCCNGLIYHRSCFKCHSCRVQLEGENAAMLDNKIFCPIHFFELHEQLKATSSKVVNGDFDCQRPPTTDRIRSVSC
uniref:LIM zinc-binding domain-containing protein n=1 Tax=Macrostomum lignano TaxID=282301 RepID=A0A1I8HJS4_9PLAT